MLEGKAIFCGKVKRKKKEREMLGEEDEIESEVPDDEVEGCGRDVEAKLTKPQS